jgi:hypothetical protein
MLCVVRHGEQIDEKNFDLARAMIVAPMINWQCIAVTLSALRTGSSIALSVLPLLKGICAMAFEVPYELEKATVRTTPSPLSQCSAFCPPASHSLSLAPRRCRRRRLLRRRRSARIRNIYIAGRSGRASGRRPFCLRHRALSFFIFVGVIVSCGPKATKRRPSNVCVAALQPRVQPVPFPSIYLRCGRAHDFSLCRGASPR